MIPVMDGRQRAARAVAARRGELGMTQQELASVAGVDTKTIGNLERRGRWPIARTRALMEKALHWPVGEMERIASSDEEPKPPRVRPEVLREMYADIRASVPADEAELMIANIEAALRGDPPPVLKGRGGERAEAR